MIHTVKTKWIDNMQFESENPGGNLFIDAAEEFGGNNQGYSPKALMLSALAGCSGLDVVSLLRKMRVEVEKFSIDVEAHLTKEHPKYYDQVHLIYNFHGKGLKQDKIEKAVKMSKDKYCGVMEMFKKFAKVTAEIKYFEQ
ncbi:MAG: osmotically inducible protein OsmC [Flavobacteriales bacterium]|nr:MAG: osmotically inducible protein OsmC [Flavobacteriales bacterium]